MGFKKNIAAATQEIHSWQQLDATKIQAPTETNSTTGYINRERVSMQSVLGLL
jgi:hypothetical protein